VNFAEKWTTKQAAEYLGVSTDWLLSNMRSSSIRFYRPAKKSYFFLKEDLDFWLQTKAAADGAASIPDSKALKVKLA
jgi:excisionase family DNA binding protein